MSDNENIVKLPDALERRAIRIEAAIIRKNKSDIDWGSAVIELAVELFAAKSDFPSTTAFGNWFENRFANVSKSPGEHERTILARWGATPDDLRIVLEKEETRSIQMIARNHPELGTPPRAYTRTKSVTPRVNKVEAVAQVLKEETGDWPTHKTLAQVAGVNLRNADNALRTVKAVERAVHNLPLPTYTKAQDHQVEARIKVQSKKLEAEFDERVRLRVLEENKGYLASLEMLEREARRQKELYTALVNDHKPVFTDAEYRDLLLCTHEGNPSKEVRERAFMALNAKKLQLIGKK